MTPYYDDGNGIVIYHGSAKDMSPVESGTVHTCVTSPPYWGLRAYCDDPREIGREPTPEDHLANLVDVFREVKRVLRDDGTCFLNYGDAYNGIGGPGKQNGGPIGPTAAKAIEGTKGRRVSGYKPKDLLSMPFRVVDALRRDGWYHRSTIIWSKKSPMPESVQGTRWERCRVNVASGRYDSEQSYAKGSGNITANGINERREGKEGWTATYEPCPGCDKCRDNDGYVLRMSGGRPTTSHEYVFLLTKSPSYFYNLDGNRVANKSNGDARAGKGRFEYEEKYDGTEPGTNKSFCVINPAGRNLWTVWDDIKQSSFKGAHFATFPIALADRCIRLGTSEYGCCPTCGNQWAPVVDAEFVPQQDVSSDKGIRGAMDQKKDPGNRDGFPRGTNATNIKEWRPTCTCEVNEGGRPLVVDPFSGSCTAGESAKNNGCDCVGFEINPDYIELSKKRFAQPDLFAAKETP